jgi:hypothetical protein
MNVGRIDSSAKKWFGIPVHERITRYNAAECTAFTCGRQNSRSGGAFG